MYSLKSLIRFLTAQMRCRFGLIFALVLIAKPAYAYIDPGTGSMLLQSILAIVAMLGSGIAVFWRQLKNLLKKPTLKEGGFKHAEDEKSDE